MSVLNKSIPVVLCLLLCLAFCNADRLAQASDQTDVYFSPVGGARKAIIEKLDAARSSVEVAMYILSNRELGNALIAANHRGVKVRVLLDGSQDEQYYSQGRYLSENDVQVRIDRTHMLSGDDEGIMHNKFAVIDSAIVITGSYNWTPPAEDRNDENVLIITDAPDLAGKYRAQFETLWTRGVSYDIKKLPTPLVLAATDSEALKTHSGQEGYVQGVVQTVWLSERSTTYFLHFGPDRNSFQCVIFKDTVEKFVKLKIDPREYEGKKVEIHGKIVNDPHYGLEIIVDDPAQIRILDKK